MTRSWRAWAWTTAAVGSATALALVACTGDDTPPAFFPDAGGDVVVPPDTGVDVNTPDAAVENAKVIAVHASPDMPAFRICFGIGTKGDGSDAFVAPLPPLPDSRGSASLPYPGIFPGFGGVMPDVQTDLSTKALTPYLVFASAVKSIERVDGGAPDGGFLTGCDKLVGGDAGSLVLGTDYVKLPTIAPGTLAKNSTLLLASTGCLPIASDPSASPAKCGADYNGGTGNLAIKVFVLDRKLGDPNKVGVRVVHASQPLDGVQSAAGVTGLSVSFTALVDGGSTTATVIAPADAFKFGEQKPTTSLPLAFPTSAADGTLSVTATQPDGGAAAAVTLPLPTIHTLSTGAATGADAYFAKGQNVVFVVVGDPAQTLVTDAGPNGQALHVLAFPTNPAVVPYP